MVLVVVLHVSLWAEDAFSDSRLLDLSLLLIPFRIPVFFLVSGILAANALRNKPSRAMIRAVNIYTVYLIWTTVVTVRFHATPSSSDDPGPLAYLMNAFIPGHYWYLWALPVYYGAGLLILRLSPVRPWLWLPLALGLYYFAAELAEGLRAAIPVTAETAYWEKAVSCFLWFWVGVCGSRVLRAYGDRFLRGSSVERRDILTRATLICAAAAGIALISVDLVDFGRWNGAALSLGFAVIAFVLFPMLAGTQASRALQQVGNNTLPVYIFHKILLIILMAVESRTGFLAGLAGRADVLVLLLVPVLIIVSLVLGRLIRSSRLAFLLNGFVSVAPQPGRAVSEPLS